jgi:hypothetical protein
MLSKAAADGVQLVRVSIGYVTSDYGAGYATINATVNAWNAAMATWCLANGVMNIDPNPYFAQDALSLNSLYNTGGIHRNQAGYERMAGIIASFYQAPTTTKVSHGVTSQWGTGTLALPNVGTNQDTGDASLVSLGAHFGPGNATEGTAVLTASDIQSAVGLASANLDNQLFAISAATGTLTEAERNAVADALLHRADAVDGKTVQEALRIIAAVLAGKVSGAGSGAETFTGLDGATPRVEVACDAAGNRSAINYS